MSPQQIVAVGVRLFAVWLLIDLVFSLPVYFSATAMEGEGQSMWPYYVGSSILMLVAIIVLWRFPLTIAGKLMSRDNKETGEPVSPDLWLSMGCALLGIWLIATTIPQLFWAALLFREGYYYFESPQFRYDMAMNLPGFFIGIWLIFGARGFRKLFWWARNAGRYQPK